MRDSNVFTPKIPQYKFFCMHWLTDREVVCHVGEVEEETDRVDEHNRTNERSSQLRFKKVRTYHSTIRVTNEDAFAPAVVLENRLDFFDKDVLVEGLIGYARTHCHNFNCNNSDVYAISSTFVNVPKEICVRVQTHANTMDE